MWAQILLDEHHAGAEGVYPAWQQHNADEEEAMHVGMQEMSEVFKKKGAEVCQPAQST